MVRIGTWNLENLARPSQAVGFGPSTAAAYEAKLDALAATIVAAAPDVLGVQEVADPAALSDLAGRLGGDWHTATATRFEAAHPIRVGFLSRHRLEIIGEAGAFPAPLPPVPAGDPPKPPLTAMGRDALAVRVEPAPGEPITLISVHLKSKLLSFPAVGGRSRFAPRDEAERARYASYALARRAAEAVTVRALAEDLLDGQGRDRPVVVLGDLNDAPDAATTQILHGPPGSEIGTGGFDTPDQGDARRLWNLCPLIPEGERYSRVYRGRGELIDHILVSAALAHRIQRVHIPHPGPLPSITDDPTTRRQDPGSDHAPVFADYT